MPNNCVGGGGMGVIQMQDMQGELTATDGACYIS